MQAWQTTLRTQYPWPDVSGIKPYYFSLDGGGRDLIIEALQTKNVKLMIEIGCFLCGSTLQWLESNPELTIIGVDPWASRFEGTLELYKNNPVFQPCFKKIMDKDEFIKSVKDHGAFRSALANINTYRDRFFPVQALSPRVLYDLAKLDIQPELIYFDSDKVLDDLTVAHQLFPNAILCGDDWSWGVDQGFPVQKGSHGVLQKHDSTYRSKGASWIIDKAKPVLHPLEYLKQLHEHLQPEYYAEIGVREGASMALSKCQSIGIDPAFNITKGVRCPVRLFRMTSDDFFKRYRLEDEFGGTRMDLGLVDGYHNFDFALRDFINFEKAASPRGVILLDDVMPRNVSEAALKPHGGAWAGDVWRIMHCLRDYRPDLELIPLVNAACGLLVVRNLNPYSDVLTQEYDEIVEKYTNESLYPYPGMQSLIETFGFRTVAHVSEVL